MSALLSPIQTEQPKPRNPSRALREVRRRLESGILHEAVRVSEKPVGSAKRVQSEPIVEGESAPVMLLESRPHILRRPKIGDGTIWFIGIGVNGGYSRRQI